MENKEGKEGDKGNNRPKWNSLVYTRVTMFPYNVSCMDLERLEICGEIYLVICVCVCVYMCVCICVCVCVVWLQSVVQICIYGSPFTI